MSAGIRYMLLSVFFFALMNLCVKLLVEIPTHEIVFFRSLGIFIICLILLAKNHIHPLGNQRKDLLLRGIFGTCALSAYFYTLKHIPLASAVTLQYLNPIFSTAFAIFILKEKVSLKQWACFALSFCGVLMVKGFDPRVSGLYLLIGIAAAAGSGLAYNYVRKLRHSDHPIVVIFYFSWVNLVLITPYTAFHWHTPSPQEWTLLLLIGVLTYIAQFFMTHAYHAERMAVVANLNYTGVLYALIFGYLFFQETVQLWSFLGMILIITGVLLSSRYKESDTAEPQTKNGDLSANSGKVN